MDQSRNLEHEPTSMNQKHGSIAWIKSMDQSRSVEHEPRAWIKSMDQKHGSRVRCKAWVRSVDQSMEQKHHRHYPIVTIQSTRLKDTGGHLVTSACRRISRLAQTLPDTAALCKSRGLPMQLIVSTRPDILLYSPETLMAKIDSLPSILEVSPRRARDLIVAWPALLRHSAQALKERYQTLVQLFRSLPKSFVAELLSTTPTLLAYSPASLRAKFAALVSK
ncbi:hypothetical protein DUNSADRAFT_2545 [Dunaliella salina]|uniref:Encoded protein n=1 Tax=Dunaliella salina TaxID=3046 RepID=A0ABQ7FW52_DUNSA|nr:hypothetical protein DUNSADRAFT_2545 [Dunaliella salina]|eukprot:KAF5826607.1 hypothetical protein DUNSADRAFT_2545 [Dunaliella salina]